MGLPVVGFSFVLCMTFYLIWYKFLVRKYFLSIGIVSLLFFIFLTLLIFYLNSSINLAGLSLYSINDFDLLILHDVYSILAVVVIATVAPLFSKIPLISLIGKHSLIIYLTHQIVFQLYYKFTIVTGLGENFTTLLINILLSLIVTLSISLIFGFIINKTEFIRKSVIPKNYSDWILTKRKGIKE